VKIKTGILIQARLSSSRLPNKMLMNVGKYTLLEFVFNRCKTSKLADMVGIITSLDQSDDKLYDFCISNNMPVFRGDLNNVLQRYIHGGDYFNVDIIARVCGDSPFVDINNLDYMFEIIQKNKLEYIKNTNCLNGFLSEIIDINLLKKVYNIGLSKDDLEHVTKYIQNNIDDFKTKVIDSNLNNDNFKYISLTIDYKNDIILANKIIKYLDNFEFSSNDILLILQKIKDKNEI